MNRKKMSDSEKRDFILNGDMLRVILFISTPIAIYNAFNYAYGFLDAIMVSHIGAAEVSSVMYLTQITMAISAVGAGLAAGGSIIISRYYGGGDMKRARINASTLIFITTVTALITVAGILACEVPLLKAAKTPDELIAAGRGYFRFQVINLMCLSINSVFIGIEKAKGNTGNILKLNTMVMVLKLGLTIIFVYVFNYGAAMVALATLIAQSSLSLVAVRTFFSGGNIFRFSMTDVSLSRKVLLPLMRISIPIFLGKFIFSFGKVIINSMCVVYGGVVIGALGVSNKLTGAVTSICMSFEEGLSTVSSQNLGNKNLERAIDSFRKTFMVNIAIAVIGTLFMVVFTDLAVEVFAQGDEEFTRYIKMIFFFEKFAIIALSVNSSVLGMLYGFGYTRISMFLNIMRLFIFRIPSLYLLQRFTDLGAESVGWAMLISNVLIGIASLAVYFVVIGRVRREGLNSVRLESA